MMTVYESVSLHVLSELDKCVRCVECIGQVCCYLC